MRVIAAVGLLLIPFIVAPDIAHAWGPRRDLTDQTVETTIGTLKFSKMTCDQAMGSVFFWGTITNETGRAWKEVVLSVTFRDKNGDVLVHPEPGGPGIRAQVVRIHNLGVGESQRFESHSFGTSDKASDAVTLAVIDGDISVFYRVALVKPVASDALAFATDLYSISFTFQGNALHFLLKNKGDNPIRIDWNSVAYVDITGRSQGVIHNGIKLADRTASKAPTIVPPAATVEDDIVPVEHIELDGLEWITHPLLPTGLEALKLAGTEFSVFLPLDVDGRTENRSFVFKIIEVR